jgi:hypothetical protein
MSLETVGNWTIGLAWVTYAFVFLVTLYKSFEFFQQIETMEEFKDVNSIAPLKNLYLASFILQVSALAITFFLGMRVFRSS